MESGNNAEAQKLNKKAFEISYALARVAESNAAGGFSSYLERLGLELLYAVTLEQHDRALTVLQSIEYFSRLAGSTGRITSHNGEVIAEEARGLYVAVASFMHTPRASEIDVTSVFAGRNEQNAWASPSTPENIFAENKTLAASTDQEQLKAKTRESVAGTATQVRQTAILETIRQSGNQPGGCRMKDIQERFPNVSERTLRYDIQMLIEHDLIERIGQSGPSTFYRAREIALV